jgi:hypothetical protein
VEKLAASLGVVGLSKSQVSAMAAELDELVDGFRNRPLDRGPYTFCWIDALTQKVREGGRTVNVHCLIATGINADGCREILGIDVTSFEDGAGWLAFLRGLAGELGLQRGDDLSVLGADRGRIGLLEDGADQRGHPRLGGLGHPGEQVAMVVRPAPLPRGSGQHGGDRVHQPGVVVAGHEPDAGQAMGSRGRSSR